MNKTISTFARTQLKEGLEQLPESNQLLFKRMYSHANLDLSMNEVVENIPDEKLDWAMQQVERTLSKQQKDA